MQTRAPGKIILSGEHSIVHGASAIAVAVNQYANWTIQSTQKPGITLSLTNLNTRQHYSLNQLNLLYHTYLSLQETSHHPPSESDHIYLYSIAYFLKCYLKDAHSIALHLSLDSQIPIGAGMGSSAATLSALQIALHQHFKVNYNHLKITELTAQFEKIQHGCISQIDSRIVTSGGIIEVYNQQATPFKCNLNHQWRLIFTGIPESTTGACVSYVKQHFTHSAIWSEFQAVTSALKHALGIESFQLIREALMHNQTLLNSLKIVPHKIQHFIDQLEASGNIAAKITGAGSLTGDKGGFLIAYLSPDDTCFSIFNSICQQYHYPHYPLIIDYQGVTYFDHL